MAKLLRKAAKITRRTFLVSSAIVAGGAAFGVWEAARDLPNPLAPRTGTALNPWLILDAEGATIIVPRAEMGQGVATTLAVLLAEELDLDWEGVRVLHGPAAAAYYNGELIRGALPFADYNRAGWVDAVGNASFVLPKALGLQVTGGSTSTADAFVPMRAAGATAREALKAAASARLGLPAASLRTESGAVIAPDGTALPYAALAAEAAALTVGAVALRDPSEWKLLGRAQPRSDMRAKITGQAVFGIDVRPPGLRFATLRRAPAFGGKLLHIDATPALALPGVERVLELAEGFAVVAANSWAALQGAAAVAAQWSTPADAPDTAEIFARLDHALGGRANSRLRNRGNAGAPPPAGATAISAEYRLPYLAHATMEPMNATALFDAGHLTLWAGTQAPLLAARAAARALGIGADAVTINTTFLGGGFGRRVETDFIVPAALLAQQMPGTPVQLLWSREEDMTHDTYRPAVLARASGWVHEGRAGAMDLAIAGQSVTRAAGKRMTGLTALGPDRGHVDGAFDQPYAIPNYRVRGYLAKLPVPVGFWRSVGASFNGFIHESFLDELAHAAGRDPLEFRLELMRPEHARSAAVLEAVAALAGWAEPKRPNTGRGLAVTISFDTPVAEVVEVEQRGPAIAITRAFIACDPGIALDPAIVEAQMFSGLIYGLSAAVHGEISLAKGAVEQQNFPDYEALRMDTAPAVAVRIVQSGGNPTGVGEPGTPPAAAALANALFDLTGIRARTLPLGKSFRFA
jgi:isoquinoline 1-oxidoreductase beta subunit